MPPGLVPYNISARTVGLDVLRACRDRGAGVLAWSPLGSGLLGGVLEATDGGRRAQPGHRKRMGEKRETLVAYEGVCRDLGEKPAAVALAWLLANDVVTAPIIGPRTLGQLETRMRSLAIDLDKRTLRRLDAIFPGPGGQAPVAHAW